MKIDKAELDIRLLNNCKLAIVKIILWESQTKAQNTKGITYDIGKILKERNGSLNINNVIEQSKSNDIHNDLTRSYH